jgi:hypothetical protein
MVVLFFSNVAKKQHTYQSIITYQQHTYQSIQTVNHPWTPILVTSSALELYQLPEFNILGIIERRC